MTAPRLVVPRIVIWIWRDDIDISVYAGGRHNESKNNKGRERRGGRERPLEGAHFLWLGLLGFFGLKFSHLLFFMDDNDSIAGALDPSSIPRPVQTFWPSYGSAHDRPVLALSRSTGTFHVDLDTFKVGMVVSCKYLDAKGRSCGWYPGIINRILDDQKADIDYDDGAYDYAVPFSRLRPMSNYKSRTFHVSPIPAPPAIVLSISHAREAVMQAMRLDEKIRTDLESDLENDGAFSTPTHSRSSTPPAIFTVHSSGSPTNDDDDDDVEFVMERFGSSRGCASRPIVL